MKEFKMNPLQPVVSVDWLFSNRNNPDLLILDTSLKKTIAKTRQKNERLLIPNTIFFDLENTFSDLNSPLPHMMPTEETFTEEARKLGINNNSIIVVYDNVGIYSSPRVWWMFRAMGHRNVYVLNGGLPEWRKNGFDCVTSYSLPKNKGNFVAKSNPKLISDKNDILKAINDKNVLIIDVRSQERYLGEVSEPREGLRKGHIPSAVNIPFEKILNKNKLLEKDALENVFEKVTTKDRRIIFSCGSGVTACINALGATVAGYPDISVYDGSWSEWGIPSELPITE
jgi:thiosulfate/3-mercaptopyruvate sulfurtransferase